MDQGADQSAAIQKAGQTQQQGDDASQGGNDQAGNEGAGEGRPPPGVILQSCQIC